MEFALAEQGDKRTLLLEGTVKEPKFDGERAFLIKAEGKVALINRRKRNITAQFPEVARAAEILPNGIVLDGEIVVPELDGQGNCPSTAWRATTNPGKAEDLAKKMPAVFAAFDILVAGGMDCRNNPFRNRRLLLEEFSRGFPGAFFLAPQMKDGEEAWRVWVDFEGSEGVMVKRLDAPYSGRRNSAWIKVKAWEEDDFLVLGFTSQEREVSTLKLENGYEVNCPRINDGTEVKKALGEGKKVMATVMYIAPYRFPRLRKVEVV